ncbi:hypothetical protein M413DRAFT_27359 [Hebeloma cylindrosporum]|uniref:C2H2-type domain-containing protein n=1 Tax=Hebeloma cylindrosporum TaxID=76867 RepID=A0A0C3CC13_HEBCY|nr:hypothetical protein M413DRAFT_27359 [Hebeloma cylindrosporum h7]
MPQRTINPRNIICPFPSCGRTFSSKGGLTNHRRTHQTPRREPPGQPHPPTPPSQDLEPGFDMDDHLVEAVSLPGRAPSVVEEPNTNPPKAREKVEFHPYINGLPCDAEGTFLPPGAPPPPWDYPPPDDYSPFTNRPSFELADLIFRKDKMSAGNINELLQIWASTLPDDEDPPFINKQHLYDTIDKIELGDAPWHSFTVSFNGEVAEGDTTPWKRATYDVWYRDPRVVVTNQLKNPDFATEMDFAPKEVRDENGKRRYCDFMSGDWSWRQANELAKDPQNHGATFCPIILGSDKTTVSPMNHCLVLADKEHADSVEFRKFRRNLFHGSLNKILQTLRPGMEKPEILRYGDGYYRRTVFGLGPYIADYPEQVLLACVVQGWCPRCDAPWDNLDHTAGRRSHRLTEALFETIGTKALWDDYGIIDGIMPFTHGFPRADIHELLSPDLLHQIIKGTFKDHLVTWVTAYIQEVNTPADAKHILADIDRRLAAAPSFPGLRRFPEGRGFKQWTGDDSKALMKVYLPAIAGHVPPQMIRALSSFMEFCYLARRSVLDEDDLIAIDAAVANFHRDRVAFDDVRPDGYSLPRQHSIVHYTYMIREFGAPNGLCSSITESKHIKAVKEPWRRSSRFEALGQMLLTNQRLDKLAAARVDFRARGMLREPIFGELVEPEPPPLETLNEEEDDDGGAVDDDVLGEVLLAQKPIPNLPRTAQELGTRLNIPDLRGRISRFLYEQDNPDLDIPLDDVPLSACPQFEGNIRVFPSAISIYYAPSDKSGVRGMFRERIRAVESWRKGPARYDCVFVERDPDLPGFRGLYVARVRAFLSITHNKVKYPCALVWWFSTVGDSPCPDTGMWMVEPDFDQTGNRAMSIIHIDSILRGAHLMGVSSGSQFIPHHLSFSHTLDAFRSFYTKQKRKPPQRYERSQRPTDEAEDAWPELKTLKDSLMKDEAAKDPWR